MSLCLADPEGQGQVIEVIDTGVIQQRFQCKGNQWNDRHHHDDTEGQNGDRCSPGTQMEDGDVGALAGNGRIGLTVADQLLVDKHDDDRDQNHDHRQNVADTRIGTVDRGIQFSRQYVISYRQTQELRRRKGSHCTGEDQDDR